MSPGAIPAWGVTSMQGSYVKEEGGERMAGLGEVPVV